MSEAMGRNFHARTCDAEIGNGVARMKRPGTFFIRLHFNVAVTAFQYLRSQ